MGNIIWNTCAFNKGEISFLPEEGRSLKNRWQRFTYNACFPGTAKNELTPVAETYHFALFPTDTNQIENLQINIFWGNQSFKVKMTNDFFVTNISRETLMGIFTSRNDSSLFGFVTTGRIRNRVCRCVVGRSKSEMTSRDHNNYFEAHYTKFSRVVWSTSHLHT